MNFVAILEGQAAFINNALENVLAQKAALTPARLAQAMRHAVLNGGKRLRPFLWLETVKMLGGEPQDALEQALALELIHCYSLVHDDLPAMDNDDLRRGKLTVHKAYDEATAILAGDALLTLAFELAASGNNPQKIVSLLAKNAGAQGMVGGQMLDLSAEGRFTHEGSVDIVQMQSMKTGALIEAAILGGGIHVGVDPQALARLATFGALLGRSFQLADDLLDALGNEAQAGKKLQKDASHNKGTLIALHGLEWAQQELKRLTHDAVALLDIYAEKARTLQETAKYIAIRNK